MYCEPSFRRLLSKFKLLPGITHGFCKIFLSRLVRTLCPPLTITCVFVQNVMEPVYVLHYDRHVAVSAALRPILVGNPEQSVTYTQVIASSPPEMKKKKRFLSETPNGFYKIRSQ